MLTNGKKLAKIRKIFDVCKLRKKPRQSQFAPIFTLKTFISSSASYLFLSLHPSSAVQPPISLYLYIFLYTFNSLHPSSAVQPLSLSTPSTSFLFLSLYTPFISSSASFLSLYHYIFSPPISLYTLHQQFSILSLYTYTSLFVALKPLMFALASPYN